MPLLLPEKIEQNASILGKATAVRCGVASRTWVELESHSRKMAGALRAMGIGNGSRVAILADTSVEYVETLIAIIRSGASFVPLPGLATVETLALMLEDSGASAIFASEEKSEVASDAMTSCSLSLGDRQFGVGFSNDQWPDVTAGCGIVDLLPPASPEQEFNLIYSSGTTGTPKGIVHSQGLRAAQMPLAGVVGIDAESVVLLSTGLYANWTLFGLLCSLYWGCKTVLMHRFDVGKFLQILGDERVTHAFLVPVQITRLLDAPQFDETVRGMDVTKLTAGSPLPAAAKRDVLRRWPGLLIENYGQTEGAPTTLLFANQHPDKLDSVGVVTPGGEIKIIDDQGRELRSGETGEVVGRTGAMMEGYFKRPDLTAELEWFDGSGQRFFRSGDLGRLDDDGFLYLVGRKKDVIISGGMNVYACDIEEVLLSHPEVTQAAVIGIPSEHWGETPMAFVVTRDGASVNPAGLQDWANARLGKTQRLSAVEFRDNLPRGTLDKVLKNKLREPYWTEHQANQ